jgi:hypothetical protein
MIALAAVAAVLWVSGCAGPGEYPVSRAKAGADDPVLEMPVPPLPEALRRG